MSRLRPIDLDDAWARGWFRMRQSLFTTHFLDFGDSFHSAIWLRIDLHRLEAADLKPKGSRRWRSEFHRLTSEGPDGDREILYQKYRSSLPFEVAPTLRDLLFGDENGSCFDTWEAAFYDDDRLVAAGYFDCADQGAAGIVAFYDPEVKKLSPGKELINAKMAFCRNQGLRWFYPGYVAPGYPRFDYKWNLGRRGLQYLDLQRGHWVTHRAGTPVPDPLAIMKERLEALQALFAARGRGAPLQFYRHQRINLDPQFQGAHLFDFPLFLNLTDENGAPPWIVVVFHPQDSQFHVLQCRSLYRVWGPGNGDGFFESDLLAAERLLGSFATEEAAVDALGRVFAGS